MITDHFCAALRAAVRVFIERHTETELQTMLEDPVALGEQIVPSIKAILESEGVTTLADVIAYAWSAPAVHLRSVFDPTQLPDTPLAFTPVPQSPSTTIAMVTAVAAFAALGSATISYGSENSGHLFVNLVVIPGTGDIPKKSTKSMSGHTDGVSFPIRGLSDPGDKRIAPSPDFVGLCCLRNPDAVSTNVISLKDVLDGMPDNLVEELRKPQYWITSQRTFESGMREILGDELVLDEAGLLFRIGDTNWIRYSHSSTGPADPDSAAQEAIDQFQAGCIQHVRGIELSPGDIVLVNNRIALHGRATVGSEYGGKTRWLLRTYGLDTSSLKPEQRYPESQFKLFP
ncbi:TauD/TfdA family dioxygenase [Aeromonas dhakensis]|uniref:TauD/TfdA family dioxygenase n=1 Tax=Aeromonas dhakensis TaxID=196024 RepID=UPI001BCD194B|nr:TauD/TfdA family dioxygenase [Aeromonas dhakensis]MBS4718218.1 TauD/TfdA family dioxygenase [Aeromonas dhakensis]MDX7698148.1 TauD/TfdA family dioxygenase [Aeromonas dhakensis]HDZ8879014.1 TauD/TfdA family dioxygenase [Aeromonas dhakensis]